MDVSLHAASLNMAVALTCGAVIGSERQVRQRMAGLRTNALVALGAAGFVIFSGLFPDEVSHTRVAAQIVSGIGLAAWPVTAICAMCWPTKAWPCPAAPNWRRAWVAACPCS